ncbi:MAG: LPS export ABC transporter periplasmic protein LptC [bacterium]
MFIPNGRITGNTTDKLYHVEGGLEVYYFDVKITADEADIDQNTETATLSGNVFFEDPEYRITCNKLFVDYKNNWMSAEGFVQFNRYNEGKAKVVETLSKRNRLITVLKNKTTKVYCGKLNYNWDTEDFSAEGEVKVVQEGLTIEASEMSYEKATGNYSLSGDVVLVMDNYDWLYQAKVVAQEDADLVKSLTKRKTTIKCESMLVNDENGNVRCLKGTGEDRVTVDQGDKRLECDDLAVDDAKKTMTTKGNVKYWQKDGNWLVEGGLIKREEAEKELLDEIQEPMTILAETMLFDYDKRKMEGLAGDGETIKIEGRKGRGAQSKKMTFDDKEKLLEMSGGVIINSGEEFLYCDSLSADTDNKVYIFSGDVDGFFMYQNREKKGEAEEIAPADSGNANGSQSRESTR